MKLSARIQSLTASPIRKLSPYADAAKAQGKKIYHLNIGQPDIKTPEQFMESIRNYDETVIAYGNSKGEGFMIEAIRKYYAEKGMDFAAEDIFITNGGSEALVFAVMALCDPVTRLWFLNRITLIILLSPRSSAPRSTLCRPV